MDQASQDLLLMIFERMNSKEMVSAMQVERKWLKIINENKALWRELVLASTNPRWQGWGLQALELFDRKLNSTLKRVSMHVDSAVDEGSLVETLEKSKDTLQVLEIKRRSYSVKEALEENLWKFPNLVECRMTNPSTRYYILSLQLGEGDEDQEDNKGSSLRVLWIDDYSEKLFKSHLYILDNLVSLVLLDGRQGFVEMRRILERPSRTLKHLRIAFNEDEESEVPRLSFPNLKFLDIRLDDFASVFPSWMRLPSLSTLIIRKPRTLSSVPACSKLWLVHLKEFKDLSELTSQCPELVQLTMDLSPRSYDPRSTELPASERFENLSSMLSQRKANVENGVEIEGVKMINLKTLVIPFERVGLEGKTGLKKVGLSKLRELVENVVDLSETVRENSEIIEMEV